MTDLALFDASTARDRTVCPCCARPWGYVASEDRYVHPLRYNCHVCHRSTVTCQWCEDRPGGAPCVPGAHDEADQRSRETRALNRARGFHDPEPEDAPAA